MLSAGWRLVWRRQRLLWWIYLLSLALGVFSAQPLDSMISPVLGHSLASDRLYHSFDLATLMELLMRPEVSPSTPALAAVFFAVIFLVLMLLLTGGVLKVYNEDRTFATGEFFSAGGEYFWRFVRLAIVLLVVLLPIAGLCWAFNSWSDSLSERYAQPAPSVGVGLAGAVVALFLLMAVRLWFDLAEVHAVAEGEYAVRRALARAWRLTGSNFGSLFWIYLRLALFMWLGTGVVAWVWVRWVPHEAVGVSLVLSQAVVFWWILNRLWLRACETLWYQQHSAAPLAAERRFAASFEVESAGAGAPPGQVSL